MIKIFFISLPSMNNNNMKPFKDLEPEALWGYFHEITKIPRPSKKEEKIIAYLMDFGQSHQLETKKDHVGNILIRKPATKGKEKTKTVVLQSHVDMVCEKNSEVEHDFENDPIQPYIDGEWVKAKGTTLGADDGIGIAAMLAILEARNIEHGPIECLFTVDEETGLTGAFELQPGFFQGKTLINLDSEDEGELFIGCAGGIDTICNLNYKEKKASNNQIACRIFLKGLKGGHSGDEIHLGLANSIKLLTRLLWTCNKTFHVRISKLEGGNLRNAIPREAYADLTVPAENYDQFERYVFDFQDMVKKEYAKTEPHLNINISAIDKPKAVMSRKTQKKLLNALLACPHGVVSWSKEIDNLVETSTNLAAVKFIEKNNIQITTSQRSSVESAKETIANTIESIFELAGAKVIHSGGYPGWSPNMKSEILNITRDSYLHLFGKEPEVKAIHAGLECGLFLKKYPGLDMISFGPTIKRAHSPDEKLHVFSTGKFWELLIDVLEKIPEY